MPPGMFTIAIRLPWEIFALEILYSLFIGILCLLIYLKTKEIYELSKHRGLFHFRNIFLYFALSYLLRSFMIVLPLTREIFHFEIRMLLFMPLIFLLTGYFSTMAILSLAMTIILRDIKVDDSFLNVFMHAIAILFSVIVFFSRSHPVLILMQTFLFLVCVIYSFAAKKEKHAKFSQNKVTYALLFLFWILNVLAAGRRIIPREGDIFLYLVSAVVFTYIFLRVRKRLASNGKKKR